MVMIKRRRRIILMIKSSRVESKGGMVMIKRENKDYDDYSNDKKNDDIEE